MLESGRLGVRLAPTGFDDIMEGCIFCKVVKGELPSFKIYEDADVLAFLDIRPAVEGHTVVVPKRHYENIFDIPDELIGKVTVVAKRISIRYKEKMKLDGINILSSNGRAADQEVMHFHMHVIPRRKEDSHDLRISNYGRDGKDLKSIWERLKE